MKISKFIFSAVAIACVVCTLSAVYVAPSFWTMFEKTETEKIEK